MGLVGNDFLSLAGRRDLFERVGHGAARIYQRMEKRLVSFEAASGIVPCNCYRRGEMRFFSILISPAPPNMTFGGCILSLRIARRLKMFPDVCHLEVNDSVPGKESGSIPHRKHH